jgi:hypothetical protein
MAEATAACLMIAPEENRDDLVAAALEVFRDALAEYGVAVSTDDLSYCANLITARLAKMTAASSPVAGTA